MKLVENTVRKIESSPRLRSPRKPRAKRAKPVTTPKVDVLAGLEPWEIKNLGVVDQVVLATRPENKVALRIGAYLGSSAPLVTYLVAHLGLDFEKPLQEQWIAALVLGGLIYSSLTVYEWMKRALGNKGLKAMGFVVLMEGTMAFVHGSLWWVTLIPLSILIGINAVAMGCTMSLDRKR